MNGYFQGVQTYMALVLAVVVMSLAAQPMAAQSVQTTPNGSPQTLGQSTIEFSDVWTFDAENSDDESLLLAHNDLQSTIFIIGQVEGEGQDVETAISDFNTGFFGAFGDGDEQELTSGMLDQATAWRLFSVSQGTIPFGVIVTANTTELPGMVSISVLVSPAGSIDLALTAVQDGVSINGTGTPVNSLEPAEAAGILENGQPSTGSPDAQADPTEPASGRLQLPPVDATPTPVQGTTPNTTEVTIANAPITYPDDWEYLLDVGDVDESAFFRSADGALFISTPETQGDIEASLRDFDEGFFGTFGATDVVEVDRQLLPSGRAYSVHTGVEDGAPAVIVAYADTTTKPGAFQVQMVISSADALETVVTDVKESFTVGGAAALEELDPAELSSLLSGEEPASIGVGQTGQAGQQPATSLTVSGDVSQYELQDAQGSCDTIGWVVTSPDQLPASEADVNFRSACVANDTYFASCGTVPGTDVFAPEPGEIWLRCDVAARIADTPATLTLFDFTLEDDAGGEHALDISGLGLQQDRAEFPEGQIAPGETARGSVIFGIPETAPGPWVIHVQPVALVITGIEPGLLVIEGELQPFEVFGQ